jgi:hypothetical protein
MKNYDGLTPPISDYIMNISLSADTARTITWPSGANIANISSQLPVWVTSGVTTAQVPTGDVLDGTGSAFNKAQFARNYDTIFSVISATDQVISIEFWA